METRFKSEFEKVCRTILDENVKRKSDDRDVKAWCKSASSLNWVMESWPNVILRDLENIGVVRRIPTNIYPEWLDFFNITWPEIDGIRKRKILYLVDDKGLKNLLNNPPESYSAWKEFIVNRKIDWSDVKEEIKRRERLKRALKDIEKRAKSAGGKNQFLKDLIKELKSQLVSSQEKASSS